MAWAATAASIRVCSREVIEVTLDHLFGWACCYLFVMLSLTSFQSPLYDFMLIFNSHWCNVVLIVKKKGKVHPRTGTEWPIGVVDV